MTDLIQNLAKSAGIDNSKAEMGLGALLSSVKENVPTDTFSQISSSIPGVGDLLSKFAGGSKSTGDSGGLMGMAGSLLGGDSKGMTSLISNFSKAGFTMDTAKVFIPVAINLLKDKLSPELMSKVSELVPSGLLSGGTGKASPVDQIKKLF
ncbi:MAG: DUF2780 domain-containing protein [Ignavibacteria bacterium]|nr:DUF2780 domain-containing protein [Ignavibacteria bacterium]